MGTPGGLVVIRFIDLRKQGTASRFAFFNTVSDKFVTVDGYQVWDTWSEFRECAEVQGIVAGAINVDRFRSLCPEWAFVPPTEEEQIENA